MLDGLLVSEILGIFAPTIFSLLQYKRKAPANESFPDQLRFSKVTESEPMVDTWYIYHVKITKEDS